MMNDREMTRAESLEGILAPWNEELKKQERERDRQILDAHVNGGDVAAVLVDFAPLRKERAQWHRTAEMLLVSHALQTASKAACEPQWPSERRIELSAGDTGVDSAECPARDAGEAGAEFPQKDGDK